ncbi:beta-1,3-glucan-binding protein-like [Onthophagus taurus]|uniref:beta-1,3-glucan-binding protein-like n=1 Tax=Onthophagus taurus TaxID=166361 RepID=UPI0039BE3C9F
MQLIHTCVINLILLGNFIPIVLCQLQFGGLPSSLFGKSLFPDISFRAYKPKGFQVNIKKRNDVLELVKFSYQINNGIVHTPKMENLLFDWTYFDPNKKVKINDFVNYTIEIISNHFDPTKAFGGSGNFKFGFNFGAQRYNYVDNQSVTITVLESLCESTLANQLTAKINCDEENAIFEDDFSNGILNKTLWTVEHYIPVYSEENFEFVSYQDNPECVFISNSNLHLKPTVVPSPRIFGTLDLTQKCTRSVSQACFYKQLGANYLPPITSGKIVSNFSFKYGKVEIKAKLPRGDWIFPQIELIPDDLTKKYPKFLIGYSRGNKNLVTKEGKEIGSSILFGGYLKSSEEMRDINILKNINLSENLRNKMNIFTLTWTPDKITLAVNNDVYSTTYQTVNEGNYRISLGVGVGGNFDFPDDSKSGNFMKPWKNDAVKQLKEFLDHKNDWINSWIDNEVDLQVEYVKVFAV